MLAQATVSSPTITISDWFRPDSRRSPPVKISPPVTNTPTPIRISRRTIGCILPPLLLPSKYHRRKSVDEAGSSAAGLAKPAATKYHGREPVGSLFAGPFSFHGYYHDGDGSNEKCAQSDSG